MVYLLRIDSTAVKGRLRRYLHRRFGRRVYIGAEKAGGMPCCVVTAESDGGICWQEVEQMLSGEPEVVVPKYLKLPQNLHFQRTDGERLRRRILVNGALYVLEKAVADGFEAKSVVLLDRNGTHSSVLPRLLQSSQTVTVVTNDEQGYAELADRLFGTLGAAPVVTSSASAASGCEVLIAPDGISGFGAVEIAKIMFTPDRRDGFSVDSGCINAPFSQKLLADYDAYDLLTAFSGQKRLADINTAVPHSFIRGSEIIALNEVCSLFCT